MTERLVDGLCAPCRNGDHRACRLVLGCQCWGRWSPDQQAIVPCEGLAKGTPGGQALTAWHCLPACVQQACGCDGGSDWTVPCTGSPSGVKWLTYGRPSSIRAPEHNAICRSIQSTSSLLR